MERRGRTDKPARILAAARAEFAQHGYHGTSIDSIVGRAEVARATFYAHFQGKRDVFGAVLEELIAHVYQALPPIDPHGAVAAQALRNIERVLHTLLDDGDLARILMMEGFGPDPDSREKILRLHERLVRYAEDTLALGQRLGMVRPGDVRVMGACVIGALKEVVYQHAAGLKSRAELAAYPRELLAMWFVGLGTNAVRDEALALDLLPRPASATERAG